MEELAHSEAVELFQKQLALLRKRLLQDPNAFRDMFVADGTQAIVWEFRQEELGAAFTRTLWDLLLRGDDMSAILQRFIWNVPLKFKRKFIRAIDVHLSDRYPMFRACRKAGPGENSIPPYMRPAEERSRDFGLVNQGYLGYMSQGYTRPRSRSVRLAGSAARQAVRGPALRNRRAGAGQVGAQGRLPGEDPHPRDAGPAGHRAGSARRWN